MKKIISLLLLVAIMAALASCAVGGNGGNTGNNNSGIAANIDELYARSAPTKTVTVIENNLSGVVLTDTITVVAGKLDGTIAAAVLTETVERIRSIESGSSAEVKDYIEKSTTVTEYLEGKGTRVDGGAWNSKGESFVPTNGSIAIKLTNADMSNLRVRSDSYAFTVPAASTESVFGEAIASDVEVILTHDGASVVSLSLKYVLAEDAANSVPETSVKITVEYYYDAQEITIQ